MLIGNHTCAHKNEAPCYLAVEDWQGRNYTIWIISDAHIDWMRNLTYEVWGGYRTALFTEVLQLMYLLASALNGTFKSWIHIKPCVFGIVGSVPLEISYIKHRCLPVWALENQNITERNRIDIRLKVGSCIRQLYTEGLKHEKKDVRLENRIFLPCV